MSDKDLRNEVIRLAHSNPKLREQLLPLLKESATKSQSFSLMQSYRSMYGDSTANYYKALLNALYNKQVIPSVIVGGGLRNPVGVAEKYLKKKIAEAERAGNIGQGNVTVSKPARPSLSDTDGYYYYVKDDSTKTLLYFGQTPSHRGADRAVNRARQLVMTLISYGNHYYDDLQEQLNSNRKLSTLPTEKKSIATKDYDEHKVKSGWLSATSGSHRSNYETRDFGSYNAEHLTRKEKKLLAKFLKATAKQGNLAKSSGSVSPFLLTNFSSGHIEYRMESLGKPTARCMVLFKHTVLSRKPIATQNLISDLNDFEKKCFSMSKSMVKLFEMKGLGTLDFSENFVRNEFGKKYPLLGKFSVYFNIDESKLDEIIKVLEKAFGASEIGSVSY